MSGARADEVVGLPLELVGAHPPARHAATLARKPKAPMPAHPLEAALAKADRKPTQTLSIPAAEAPKPAPSPAPLPAPVVALAAPVAAESDVKTFCGNVGTAASDARTAWQAAKLAELAKALDARIAEVEAKTKDYRAWLARRDDAVRRADDVVVAIYARMRPETAALQLASLDDAMAAAVLMKLNPRNAGAILNEMAAERAARLTDEMSGGKGTPAAASSTPAPGGAS